MKVRGISGVFVSFCFGGGSRVIGIIGFICFFWVRFEGRVGGEEK